MRCDAMQYTNDIIQCQEYDIVASPLTFNQQSDLLTFFPNEKLTS